MEGCLGRLLAQTAQLRPSENIWNSASSDLVLFENADQSWQSRLLDIIGKVDDSTRFLLQECRACEVSGKSPYGPLAASFFKCSEMPSLLSAKSFSSLMMALLALPFALPDKVSVRATIASVTS